MSHLAKHLGLQQQTLWARIDAGLPEEEWANDLHDYSIKYMGDEFPSINQLANHLGIGRLTLLRRIKRGWPQEKWGDVGGTFVSTGYTLEEAPKNLKYAAEKLALGLNISAMEAYQLLLEKIDFTNL